MTGAGGQARLVLVVGVGRSGTSLLSGILAQLGFHIPEPEVRADRTNPRGFGEPRWVVDFHKRLLRERRVTVNDARPAAWERTAAAAEDRAVAGELRAWLADQAAGADALVVKDPRTVWFLPLWMRCAEELGLATSFVTMLRHPAEIVASARQSYGTRQTEANRAAAWINVMLQTERATRDSARAFVRYEDLLTDWPAQLRRLGTALDDPVLAGVRRDAHPGIDAFVDPELHLNRGQWQGPGVPPAVRTLADEVFARVGELADADAPVAPVVAALDESRSAYEALYGEAEAIAQSSVMAARPRRGPGRGSTPAPALSLRVRMARRIPGQPRRRLRRALDALSGRRPRRT